MRILVLLALTVLAFAETPALDVNLPLIPEAAPDDGKEPDDRVVVSLTGDGRIVFRGKTVNLDQLSSALRTAKRDYHLRQAKKGKSGEVEVAPGVRACALHVLLRADAEAPWGHVEWIETILAEQKYFRLEHAVLRKAGEKQELGKIAVPLPTDPGIRPPGAEPTNELKITVSITSDQPRPADWGPLGKQSKVDRPTRITYQVGSEPMRDLAKARKRVVDLCKGIEHVKPTKDTIVIADIRAADKVPCKHVLAFAALLKAQGIEHVHVFGCTIPDAATRRLENLPYPTRNDIPAGVGGSAGVGGLFDEPGNGLHEPR